MKKIYWFIICILMPVLSYADANRDWSAGALTWNDFKGESVLVGVPSYLKTNLYILPITTNSDGKTMVKIQAKATMNQERSFVDSTYRNDQRLRYHQLQFDMLELYRRDLQADINSGMTGTQADERAKYYNGLYQSSLDKILDQTKNGKDDARLQEWEYIARKGLEENAALNPRQIEEGKFKYGFYLGTGAIFPTSSIKDAFSSSWTFTAGLNFGYRRLTAKAGITYGQPKVGLNILGIQDQRSIGTYGSFLDVDVTFGYSILDTKRFTITPHVGGMWTNYQWNVGNFETIEGEEKLKNTESPTLNNFNWYAGIDFDFHFLTVVSENAFFLSGKREQYISSIRVTPYISRAVYTKANPELRGLQVGFTVSYVGLAHSLGF